MFKLIACLCLSLGLYAEAEYEIILLAPKGQEVADSETVFSYALNGAGYVWSTFAGSSATIYHQSFGTKTVLSMNENTSLKITDMNNCGLAVGILTTTGWHGCTTSERIFTYDTQKDEYSEIVDLNDTKECFFVYTKIENLTISDLNEIHFRKNWDSPLTSYNLNEKIERTLTSLNCYATNANGHMIGGNKPKVYGEPKESSETWFFNNTFHTLGSLDQFNRWSVQPKVLSPNGFVAGTGFDTYHNHKIFMWSLASGLNEIDLPAERVELKAINDKGQLLGFTHDAFILCPEFGFIDLGELEENEDSYPNALNNKGQVVGRSADKAFVWDFERGMRDLNQLIPEDTIGWTNLYNAENINDAGCILGIGSYYGVDRYFLLVPKN